MVEIVEADPILHREAVAALFSDYLTWFHEGFLRDYGIDFDVAAAVEENMQNLEKFLPPAGNMLLAKVGDDFAGVACLRALYPNICEVKRVFVRPDYRGQGIGRTLLLALLYKGRARGFTTVWLDSAPFMVEAHELYRSLGFQRISPYPESEVPTALHANWLFMARSLAWK